MKKKDTLLAAVLLFCLLCAAAAALLLIPGEEAAQPHPQTGYQLSISEICAKNETIIADNDGKFRDYIEIYNSGETVNLAGFCLTDGKKRSQPFGDIQLAAGECRIVFLGDDLTGFALSASGGDCVQLLDPNGSIVFQANTGACGEDQVLLLSGSSYVLCADASPGFPNDGAGLAAFREGSLDDTPTLVISEVLIGNISSLPDEKGVYSDVVELYNTSEAPIQLGDYFLSDSASRRLRWRMPQYTLNPGDRTVIFCDGENYIGENGELHANFALSAGETVYLTDSRGRYTAVTAGYAGDDRSLSRGDDGSYEAGPVSLGYANSEAGQLAFSASRVNGQSALVISEVLLSSAGVPYDGTLTDVVEITNRSRETVSTQGWYLSDGGDPYAYGLEPAELAPGACMVVLCGPATTGFSLSRGESLVLTGPDFRHAPAVTCSAEPGQSLSLHSGDETAYSHSLPTPGWSNDESGLAQYLQTALPRELQISEIMSANASYLKGAYGTTCDWVELYNASGEDILLSGYSLTDDPGEPYRHTLPEKTLAPGEYCVILLTDQTENLPKGYSVLSMTLSAEGDCLYLTRGDTVEDYVLLPSLETDVSYGRPDGSAAFTALAGVTAGKANGDAAQLSAPPRAVTGQGIYNGVEYVDVVLEGAGDIYYTTDCTTPGRKATLYTGPIRLTETTVLRVVCREAGKAQSTTLDLTYLINELDTLDVVCLVTEDDNLWDYETGIYVAGPGGDGEFPYYGANYWKDWEYPATVSMFSLDGSGFSTSCGVKIYGAFSRALPKKSLVLFFRDIYGDKELNYPLFGEDGPDTYEAFVLRSSGQDAFMGRMRDVLITSLAAEQTDLAVQKYRPVVVYLNGEYFGLHYIREKINEHYVAGNYNTDPAAVTVTERNGSSSQEYLDIVRYARTHDLNEQEHYDYVCSQVDVQEYMDYIIAQICIGNTDNSNVKFFKTTEGKWTWILYDTDLAFRDHTFNAVANHLNPEGTGALNGTRTTLINALLKRDEFREAFLRRFAWQMRNIWNEETVLRRIDEIVATISADMVKDCARWRVSYGDWEHHVESIRRFARNREYYLLTHIKDYFHLTTAEMREYGFNV